MTDKLTFPADLANESPMIVRFRLYGTVETSESDPEVTIMLPAPLQLSNVYSVSFDDLEAGLLEKTFSDIVTAAEDVNNSTGALDTAAAVFGGFNSVVGNAAANVIGGSGIVRRAIGSNINKKNELVINKPQNRSFNLRFQLVPTKKEESETIQKIIKAFKIAMHPPTNKSLDNGSTDAAAGGAGGIFFLNPARVKVDFLFQNIQNGSINENNKSKKIFSTSYCFIESLDVNYHNAGAPAYFGDGQPGNMAFSLNIKEIRPNSREMIARIDYDDRNATVSGFGTVGTAAGDALDKVNTALEALGLDPVVMNTEDN